MIRYYIAPYGTVSAYGRTPNASKCYPYLIQYEPNAFHSAVYALPEKDWCFTVVNGSASLHSFIQADNDIILIPLFNDSLEYVSVNSQVLDLSISSRTQILTFLENRNVPTGWITLNTTIKEVLSFVIRFLSIVQLLGDRFPNLDLSMTVGDIPVEKRNQIADFLVSRGIDISDITAETTIRTLIEAMIFRYPWKKFVPRLMDWAEANDG